LIDKIPLGLYWWGIIVFSIIGIDCFVLFGLLDHRARSAWCVACKNIAKGDKYYKYKKDD